MEYTEQQKQIYNDVCDKYKHNWLNTTISQTMAMEMISKALNIHNVSQQRELLPDFLYKDDFGIKIGYQGDTEVSEEWNDYLKKLGNCG
jgi:hypothetical protein